MKKVIGTILIVAAGIMTYVLLISGRLIFPHIIGPITLAVIGMFILFARKRIDNSSK